MRGTATGLFLLIATFGPAAAAPYIAYIANVVVHSPSPGARIMVVDVATGEGVNVSEGLYSARSPAWAPGGARVAFEAIDDGLNDIFVCAADGSDRANATNTPDLWEAAPAFIEEGRIAYLEGPDRSDVWSLDLTTGVKKKLTERAAFHGTPVVSANGSTIAITASAGLAGPGDILLISANGGGVRNLTNSPAVYSAPCFSPDATSIAFCFDGREIGGAARGLAIMPVAGGEPTLLAEDGYPPAPLSFSPDGTRIAYTSSTVYHSTWINLINTDGSDKQRLEVSPFHIIAWPSFSPDGKSLAYRGVYAARYFVHVVDLETGENERIAPDAVTGVNPVFSPR